MKVNRINILIPSATNKHVKYLYNYGWDLMVKYKCGGIITNESIKLNSISDEVLKDLKDLKINYEV